MVGASDRVLPLACTLAAPAVPMLCAVLCALRPWWGSMGRHAPSMNRSSTTLRQAGNRRTCTDKHVSCSITLMHVQWQAVGMRAAHGTQTL